MFIPEFGLECDVLKCCCVSDGEVEITSPALKKELEEKIGCDITQITLCVQTSMIIIETDDFFANRALCEDIVPLSVALTEEEQMFFI